MNHRKVNMRSLGLALGLLLFSSGCGRYVKLLPPEAKGPEAVKNLVVTAEPESVVFNFNASERDAQGKALKSLDGYRIYRKELTEEDSSVFKKDGYVLVSSVKDTHLSELFKLQDVARKEGRSPRRVKVSPQLTTFSVKDTDLKSGHEYGYRIVGVNQSNIESEKERLVRVLFEGMESQISIVR